MHSEEKKMAMNNGFELDWDSTIEQDEQQYQVLEEGDYDFMVDHVEKTYVGDNSEKYAGAKMATVYFNIAVPGQEAVSVRENFILHSNFAWKIGALLVSTGIKKKGEPISGGYWSRLPGMRGRCHIVQNASKRNPDQKFNNIQSFYEPDDKKDSGTGKWAI